MVSAEDIRAAIAPIADFPEPGVTFRDITPLLATCFPETIETLAELITPQEWEQIDLIAGVDARGFLFASALAMLKRKQVTIIRKKGKLPPPVVQREYTLEYGHNVLEIKPCGLQGRPGRLLLVDDVLATGGTLAASADLCAEAGYQVQAIVTLIDLRYLNDFRWRGLQVRSLVQYHA